MGHQITRLGSIFLAGLACWLGGLGAASAQTLVPLGDDVETALLPAGISPADVEMFGELVYLWKDAEGAEPDTNIIHFVGDFALQIGRRRLDAQQAVIWMTASKFEGHDYRHFEIVLWHNAKVRDSAGTVTRGPAVFVTLNSSGKVRLSADQKTTTSSADTPVFRKAQRIRQRMLARTDEREPATQPMTVIDLGQRDVEPRPEVRRVISYQARETAIDNIDSGGVMTAMGDVYVFRSGLDGEDPLEIHADAAVLYFAQPSEKDESADQPEDDRPGRVKSESELNESPSGALGLSDAMSQGDVGQGLGNIDAVYLEGDVVLSSGSRTIRASRLFYSFRHDRALILDAVLKTFDPKRGVPIVMRASEIRQLSQREFHAENAKLTTSEFHTPHYHIGAQEVDLVDRSQRSPGTPTGMANLSGTAELRNSTFNLSGVPILYWPYSKVDLSDTETSLRSIRTGFSKGFGAEFESRWSLFNVLGLERPPGVDGTFNVDYFSARGPGMGTRLNYKTDRSFGLVRGYAISDRGEDRTSVSRFRSKEPPSSSRGRFLVRHRQYLPKDWELTFELSYLSDRNFLREYFKQEFRREKDQETLLYLKKQVDNWAFTAILQYRMMNFVTTTERLPEFAFRLIAEPVAPGLTWFSENRAGWVRYRPMSRNLFENLQWGGHERDSGTVARVDTRQELEWPLAIGDFKIVPFGSVRGTAWDDRVRAGGTGRAFATYGFRGSVYANRVYPNVESDLFDIHGIRHIVKADVVAWAANSNRDRSDLFPFDVEVDQIDDVSGASFGIRQRWQTKRGAPGKRRVVDVMTLDLEVGFFDNAPGRKLNRKLPGQREVTNGFVSYSRPENSIARNYANASLMYRINDATSLVSEMNYDINDSEMDLFDLTYAVQRTPRLSYLVAYRYIGEMDSNLLATGMNYRMNEKYTLAAREEFDVQRGETAAFDLGLIRRFPRWFVGVTFSLDAIEDDFGVSFTAWPEGLPRATLGNRRFTGLATSTNIRRP